MVLQFGHDEVGNPAGQNFRETVIVIMAVVAGVEPKMPIQGMDENFIDLLKLHIVPGEFICMWNFALVSLWRLVQLCVDSLFETVVFGLVFLAVVVTLLVLQMFLNEFCSTVEDQFFPL